MQTWIRGQIIRSALLALVPVALEAQQALVVEHGGKARVVRKVHNGTCLFEQDGQLVSSGQNARVALVSVDEFLPFFVSVSGVRSGVSYIGIVGSGTELNSQYEFSAKFESPFHLKDVFFALEMEHTAGEYVFYHEIGELLPRRQKPIRVVVPTSRMLGAGHFTMHLFSEGGELLHSEHSPLYREQMLDKMTLRRVEGLNEASLRPFVGPAPEYPQRLVKQKIEGAASVRFKVSRTGAVVGPEIVSASAPEFGESALAAIRLWRFFPVVKNGATVETMAKMPFKFSPPAGD